MHLHTHLHTYSVHAMLRLRHDVMTSASRLDVEDAFARHLGGIFFGSTSSRRQKRQFDLMKDAMHGDDDGDGLIHDIMRRARVYKSGIGVAMVMAMVMAMVIVMVKVKMLTIIGLDRLYRWSSVEDVCHYFAYVSSLDNTGNCYGNIGERRN